MTMASGTNPIRWANATFSDFRFLPVWTGTPSPSARYTAGTSDLTLDLNHAIDSSSPSSAAAASRKQMLADAVSRSVADAASSPGYVTWFALFTPNAQGTTSPQVSVKTDTVAGAVAVGSTPLCSDRTTINTANAVTNPTFKRQIFATRQGGGMALRGWSASQAPTALIQSNVAGAASSAAPFSLVGCQVQYALPTPVYYERSTSSGQ